MLLPLIATLAVTSTAVYADGRDDRTLLPQHLVNRNLPEQLEPHRLGDEFAPFSAAADVLISSSLSFDGVGPGPFHGFFFADLVVAVDIFEIGDINLDLYALGMSASNGYRATTALLPGLAGHIHLELFELAGEPVLFDVLATDLDVVTLGEGLLLETTPLEGFLGGFRWNSLELRCLFGGRVFWGGDDLFHLAFNALDGVVGGAYTFWFRGYGGDPNQLRPVGHYAQLYGRVSPIRGATIAAEYVARIGGDENVAHAVMARADYLVFIEGLSLHAGYQFRWYQTGFGPFDDLWTPTVHPAVPFREDFYQTNSFEFLGLTPYFDQWSHTVMLEAKYRISMFEIFGELEWWIRFVSDKQEPARPVVTFGNELVPGVLNRAWYRAGVRLYPLADLPHFLVAQVTNKQVFAYGSPTIATPIRFIDQFVLQVEAEIRL
jgi:hypothetical protein